MNAGAKLAAYGLVLAGVLGVGAVVGSAVGPIEVGGTSGHGAGDEDGGALPAGGLLVSQDGYTFRADDRVREPGRPGPFSFVIDGPSGAPVERYDVRHDRQLHLIVVSRDLARFAHVHPSLDDAGTWSVDLPGLEPGAYRAYADFQPTGGEPLTLGTDLTVPGEVPGPAAPHERRTALVDGYEVTLGGTPAPGDTSTLSLTVRRGDEVVTPEPYLGAAGHLVAIRDGDLAYLHVHALGDEPESPVRFGVEFPSAGRYGVYFDFAAAGEVHNAAFVVDVGPTTSGRPAGGHGS